MDIKTALLGFFLIGPPCASLAETVTFQALAIQDPITDVYFKSEGKKKTFGIPAYQLSEPQIHTGGSVVRFYAKDTQDDQENGSVKPKEKVEPLAVATLPENTPRVLIIFSKQDAKTYKCLVIPDGLDDFPAGALRVFNGTPGSIAVSYGRIEPFQLGSGEFSLIKNQSGNHPIQVAMPTAQGWKRMIGGFVNPIADGRRNIFLMAGALIRADAEGIPPRPLEMIIVDSAIPTETVENPTRPR
jgi:hypothetical protein